MNTLPLARYGPFKIAGFSRQKKVRIPHTGIYFCPIIDLWYRKNGKPDYREYNLRGPVPWYRRPSFSDRGPFEFGGLVTCKGWSPVNLAYYACLDCVEESFERGPGDQLSGWYCAAAPWIYYSGNISNGPVCH